MRKDLAVYNEATGFTIHSGGFCGKARNDVIHHLYSSVQNGIIIPISLVQDGSPHIRVITGELTEQEEAEWVDKIVWNLRVPCGTLVFEGGFDPRGPNDDFLRAVSVSPGNYQVEIYAFFWGINGSESLPSDLSEPVGTWYRRTHPDKPFPDNVKFYLGENSEEDPGHEEEWDEFYNSEDYDELEEPDLVDFLVRLIPMEQPVDSELKCDSNGWFPIGINPRKPAVCPVGIKFNRHG